MKSYGFENETFHAGNLSYKGSPDNACVEFLMEDISRNLYEKLAEQTGLLAKMNCQNFAELENCGITELENSGDEIALYADVGRNGEINMIFTCGDSYEYNIDLTKSEQDYIRSVIETEWLEKGETFNDLVDQAVQEMLVDLAVQARIDDRCQNSVER